MALLATVATFIYFTIPLFFDPTLRDLVVVYEECTDPLAAADWSNMLELIAVVALYNFGLCCVCSQLESHVVDENMVPLSIL